MKWKTEFESLMFPDDGTPPRIEEAFSLKHENLPDSIFKYRAVTDKSLENLRNNNVWLSKPQDFNDPYDCSHIIDMMHVSNITVLGMLKKQGNFSRLEEAIRHIENGGSAFDLLVEDLSHDFDGASREELQSVMRQVAMEKNEEIHAGMVKKMKGLFVLCSFSERVDSMLMWAHYANNHKGFCVEYSVSTLPVTDIRARFLYPVYYSQTLFDVSHLLLSGSEQAQFCNILINKAGLVKAKDWEYEREWRLLFTNGVIPTPGLYSMPPAKAVYLGSHIDPDHEKKILCIATDLDAKVFKMKHSAHEFKMLPILV